MRRVSLGSVFREGISRRAENREEAVIIFSFNNKFDATPNLTPGIPQMPGRIFSQPRGVSRLYGVVIIPHLSTGKSCSEFPSPSRRRRKSLFYYSISLISWCYRTFGPWGPSLAHKLIMESLKSISIFQKPFRNLKSHFLKWFQLLKTSPIDFLWATYVLCNVSQPGQTAFAVFKK